MGYHARMSGQFRKSPLLLLLAALPCLACDTGTVRDAAFHAKRDNYRLVVAGDAGDAALDEKFRALEAWFAAQGPGLNVKVEREDAADTARLAAEFGIDAVPEEFPATYLCCWHPVLRGPVVARRWPGVPAPEEAAFLRGSPALEKARELLPDHWGVVLFSRGDGADRFPEVAGLERAWAANHAPGIGVVAVDRADPREALLVALAGPDAEGEDWAAVLYGKGKLMIPVLAGEDLTTGALDRLFQRLPVPCTCLQQALTPGLDLPLLWDAALDARYDPLAAPQGYAELRLDDGGSGDRTAALVAEIPEPKAGLGLAVLVPLVAAAGLAVGAVLGTVAHARRARKEGGG